MRAEVGQIWQENSTPFLILGIEVIPEDDVSYLRYKYRLLYLADGTLDTITLAHRPIESCTWMQFVA